MAEEEAKESKLAGLKQNKMLLFIIIGVVALLLIVLIVVAILLFSGGDEPAQAPAPAEQTAQAAGGGSGGKKGGSSSLLSVGPIYPLDQFIVNLMTSGGGKRYLKTSIALELSIDKMQPELDTKRDIIRDVVINILSSKTFEEIQTSRGKDKIKEEILERVNEFLVDGRVSNIFFTEFVVQ